MEFMTSRKCVSVRQMYLLVKYLENHKDLARGKHKSKEASAVSSRLWAECADILNAEPDGDERTPKQWNKWYTDFKCRLLSRIRQKQRDTGGGPGLRSNNLSPLEKRLAALLVTNSEVVERSASPQIDEKINPLSPTHCKITSVPELPTSPLQTPDMTECFYIRNNRQGDIIVDVGPSTFERYEDIVDVASATSTHNNIKSEREASEPRQRKRRRRALKLTTPSSELERSRNMLADIESSRIEVERMMADGYNKMADAANRMADAASKSADAQCRIAVALERITKSMLARNARWSIDSSEEED